MPSANLDGSRLAFRWVAREQWFELAMYPADVVVDVGEQHDSGIDFQVVGQDTGDVGIDTVLGNSEQPTVRNEHELEGEAVPE